jgi:pyridoxal/pyridoxine/pyridoxamine kinase
LYASSEGQAGLIGHSLAEALEVMIGLPSWWDCLEFSGGGDLVTMQAAAEHLQHDEMRDQPELGAQRVQLAMALSLDLASVPLLLARLHDAVADTTPDFLLTVETGEEYGSLFGAWLPSRNPAWT